MSICRLTELDDELKDGCITEKVQIVFFFILFNWLQFNKYFDIFMLNVSVSEELYFLNIQGYWKKKCKILQKDLPDGTRDKLVNADDELQKKVITDVLKIASINLYF